MKSFGENLKVERQIAGLTQTEMARRIGVKQQQYSQWECGKVEPTLSNIIAILKVLNISLEDLVDEL